MQIIAITQQKGGVGKTTLTANLAGELMHRHQSVATFDLDDQRSLTRWARRGQGQLAGQVRAMGVTLQTRSEFRAAVQACHADYVLIDCPPGFTAPAIEAVLIAQLVLVPVGPSAQDIDSAKETLGELRAAQRMNPALRIALVPSIVNRTRWGKGLPTYLARFGEPVLPGVSAFVAHVDAYAQGLTLREYLHAGKGVEEVHQLTTAIEQFIGGGHAQAHAS